MATNNRKVSQQNAFKAPDGYFDDFEMRMMQTIKGQQTPFHSIKKSKIIAPWLGLAAAFLIIALIYNLIPQRIFTNQMEVKNESSSIFEFSTADYFTEFELIKLLTNETKTDFELYPDSLFFRDISEEDIVRLTSLR